MSAEEDQKLLSGGDAAPMEDPQQTGTGNKWNREVLITRIIYGVVGVIVLGVIAAVVVILITSMALKNIFNFFKHLPTILRIGSNTNLIPCLMVH